MYPWLVQLEYAVTQSVQGDCLVEFMPEHFCHVKHTHVEAILYDFDNQEEESFGVF